MKVSPEKLIFKLTLVSTGVLVECRAKYYLNGLVVLCGGVLIGYQIVGKII